MDDNNLYNKVTRVQLFTSVIETTLRFVEAMKRFIAHSNKFRRIQNDSSCLPSGITKTAARVSSGTCSGVNRLKLLLKICEKSDLVCGIFEMTNVTAINKRKSVIDLVTVIDAILTSRQTREKSQCLYENLMSNNFRRMAVLKKISIVN